MKILLVEDDSFFASRIIEFLMDNGLAVDKSPSAEDALDRDLMEYDAAIIDVMLPNRPDLSGISFEESRGGFMTGVAVARRMRAKIASFPVIILSAEVDGREARSWARDQGVPFVSKVEHPSRLLSALGKLGIECAIATPRAFIVHGHDEELLMETKDFLQNSLGWSEPLVLREQPNLGKAIIEKFEEVAGRVDWIFVLLSPDDKITPEGDSIELRRARQNVIFEFGFFYGMLGRKEGRVIVLKKGEVELPSDISGVVWIDVSNGVKAAGEFIRREVNARR